MRQLFRLSGFFLVASMSLSATIFSSVRGLIHGNGLAHLPPHTTLDLGLTKTFGESLALHLTALNLTNNHYLLDNSNTFGGTHFANPREIWVQLTYRFHY